MSSEFRICRICLVNDNQLELKHIFDENSEIATKIFTLSGVKIMEFANYQIPALICFNCTTNLNMAINIRRKCIESENHFRKYLTNIESVIWNKELINKDYIDEVLSDNQEKIKDEPDEYSTELFENIIDTINEESNSTGCFGSTKNQVNFNKKEMIAKHPTNRKIKVETTEPEIEISEGIAKCNLCFKSFTSLHSMKDHMRAIHQKLESSDMFKCNYCNRLFKMKYYLNRHIRNTHKKTPEREKKPREIKQKTDEEIFKEKLTGANCPYCNKFLTSRHSLNDHIRVKHEFRNFSDRFLCDICGKDFPLKYYLLRHIRAAHLKTLSYKRKEAESLPCSICGKILKSKGNLSTHEKTHKILTADEYWYCDLCGNKFKGRGEMSVHIKKRHLYNVTYPCEFCPGKSWRTLFQLQRHVKVIHQNIREFKCEWCGKEFGEKNKLICHTRIHTGEQPFHCTWENCDRKFTHQTDLRRHYWGHTGQRPYRCEIPNCLKGFMKKSELLAHENRCHPPNQSTIRTDPVQFQYQML